MTSTCLSALYKGIVSKWMSRILKEELTNTKNINKMVTEMQCYKLLK